MLERFRTVGGDARDRVRFTLGQVGLGHSSKRLTHDAEQYWRGHHGDRWINDSHWREGSVFPSDARWLALGEEHLALHQRLRRTVDGPRPLKRVIEWGCVGGANAIWFAPLAEEFVGVDVAQDSLDECLRQVSGVCATPFVKVLAEVTRPREAARAAPRPCDLFLCLYVLELVPTKDHGLEIMRIAHDLLSLNGQAFVQVKYQTGSWRTRARRRGYTSSVAGTTYRIEEFWTAMEGIGFRPEAVTLVPKNDLDERYAYFLLSRSR